ncbi:MAG: hypothetical protein AVDCRST_MAG95-1757 [uncultured Adhaeribacter sp.]|uniref:SH3b domain-containing protein n=1 Tax=uncultured Adhaeribacter sp. TaxID=448109 RepID=A0A6J4IFC9_9BACT|nr:MAG: hypothetical protein AVDCRST_MAG95-1757 [uncultured Adhaeribacter sp.]
MKKILLTLALFVQVGLTMAATPAPYQTALASNKKNMIVQVRQDNVKMFQQPGTSTTILLTINTTDRVELIRKWNAHWGLVAVNGKTGYVVYSELTQLKEQPQTQQISLRR